MHLDVASGVCVLSPYTPTDGNFEAEEDSLYRDSSRLLLSAATTDLVILAAWPNKLRRSPSRHPPTAKTVKNDFFSFVSSRHKRSHHVTWRPPTASQPWTQVHHMAFRLLTRLYLSSPSSASRIPLSRRGKPGNIPALVLPLGGMVARHQKGVTAERLFIYSATGGELPYKIVVHFRAGAVGMLRLGSKHGPSGPEAGSLTTELSRAQIKAFSCSTLPVPSCHVTRREHEGWDTARLPKPRQGKSSGRGRIRTADLQEIEPLRRSAPRSSFHPGLKALINTLAYVGARQPKCSECEITDRKVRGLGNLAVSQPSCNLRVAWQLGTGRVLQLNERFGLRPDSISPNS
ncbi:LOW QUALITY PROTEIN: hypothetical protein T265_12620 [Opisthorchis viverrini]|uniref:Uncharacterized protein n=1 Tax=Opisthorchis viverrini TaxID=6198 RepID=A0A075A215_OPIVI|nr:LOW QUALITY PROTEIN: hypothetical protein T265_12620 [Opisthorchis viverrini]KER33406.1 LOW QUALITY PROTEIN: hypothetical protein T265_12620 [Opisthorchis viverrini]